jgi:hypothetical protein
LLLGIDAGPQQTLDSLQLGHMALIGSANSDSQHPEYWSRLILDCRADAVVLGTSTSVRGIKVEQSCLRAAYDLRIPIIVVEDMPGNYRPDPHLVPDLVVVESALVVNYVRQRVGLYPSAVISGASVRYDSLRLQAKQRGRPKIKNSSRRLLWLGQPETRANLISLERLLPNLSRMGLELFFKAHPRDNGYRRGEYGQLFSGYKNKIEDVSSCDTATFFAYQPGLVLTHFSSMAIDFAFLGIPCCNVLFPDSGGKIYTEMTGLKRPILCEAGGSGTIMDTVSIERELDRLLFDEAARKTQMACFDEYFDIETLQQPIILSAIEGVVLGKQKTGR